MAEKEKIINCEEKKEIKKANFLYKIGKGLKKGTKIGSKIAKSTAKFIDNKVIEPTKENIVATKERRAEQDALRKAFEKQAEEFSVVYLDKSKQAKKIFCIIDEDNYLLKTTFDIINPTEIECFKDGRNQGYYSIRIKNKKSKFKIDYNNKELELDLFNIEYSTNKPKEQAPTTYIDNRVDNSITASKGAVVGNNNEANKETSVKIGVHLPKP